MGKHKSLRGNKQIAALCWRMRKGAREVLLITSRETRRWVIPKGWPMEDLKDFTAAKIEAFEEAGVKGHVTREPLGRFTYDKIRVDNATRVTVTVYGLEVSELLSKWPERDERKREWVSCEEAAQRIAEAGLKAIILAQK